MPSPAPPLKLKPVTVGPIVGETTPTRARIWGRGDTNIIEDKPRRCFGVLRLRPAGGAWGKPNFFKMNPNFDMTGLGIAEKLSPVTAYEYQMGYFFSDAELDDARADNLEWNETSAGSFTTGSDDPAAPRTLVVGSCRYLLKTWLGDFFDDRGDKVFRSILDLADKGPIHQIVMVGDQIYADDLNAVNPDKTVEQFYQRYRDAFTQPHVRKLMSQVPTYMTLDDHEIEDNWPAKATQKDFTTLFPVAMHAYQTYQFSHGPSIPIVKGRLEGTPKYLWYDYADGCCEVFVTDSRTERMLQGGKERQMLGDAQVAAPFQHSGIRSLEFT